MGEQTAAAVLGKSTDRLFAEGMRGLRERVTWLAGTPGARVVAAAVREAHLRALKQVIQNFGHAAPVEWAREPHTRPDLFFERAGAFCTRALREVKDPSAQLGLDIGPLNEAIDGLLSGPSSDGSAERRAALVAALAEDAVLDELREAISDVVLPPGFEQHFHEGAGDKPRFLDLFAAQVIAQLRDNAGFRDVFLAERLLTVQGLAWEGRELVRQMDERFGPSLERVEAKLDEHSDTLNAILARISIEKGVPYGVLRTILHRLGEANVPDEQVAERLEAKAEEFLTLREQLSRITSGRVDVAAVRSEAAALIEAADLAGARTLLQTARERSRAAQARDEAMLLADEAGLDRLELRYLSAAEKFGEAAALVKELDPDACVGYLTSRGSVLYDQGVEFGDNDALRSSVSVWKTAAELRPRERYPVEWVQVQNRLGSALGVLGDRETGTSSLEQAVAAFRAAAEEVSPDGEPLEWVRCQNNMANVLLNLAERQPETKRIHQAVAAYHAALEVLPRELEPFNWGMLQNNLGNAFLAMARREGRPECFEMAITAFQAALEEWTRDRHPLQWAIAHGNLGNAFGGLGERERDTQYLDQSIAAYQAVLQVSTRERVPLDWALTQQNLGSTLTVRGRLESGTGFLTQAITHLRLALEEATRERSAWDWATAQGTLGEAFAELGTREGDAERVAEAVAAYRAALEVFEEARAGHFLDVTRTNLATALALLSTLNSGEGEPGALARRTS